jgi:phosphoserine phosphatase
MVRTPPFAAVCFDCDSTLSAIEGVDELTRGLPKVQQEQLLALTQQAMEGSVRLEQVYGSRLRVLAPGREQLEAVGRLYVERTMPDAAMVIRALQSLGKRTAIVSGGLLPAVRVLADHLQIPSGDVHAVDVRFAADGSYAGFDETSPLARSGGKIAVLRALAPSFRPLCFVGDGATDLETQGTADLFVGYGGVAVRPKVQAHAEAWFATPSLAPVLRFALTDAERERLGADRRFRGLLERAEAG